MGDFNHRVVGEAINEVGEFTALSTGPTRGNSTIDLIYTNTNWGALCHAGTPVP